MWHPVKNISNNFTSSSFHPLCSPDASALLSLKPNFSLKLLLLTQLWKTLCMFLPFTPPLAIPCLLLKFLRVKSSITMYPRKAYGPNGVPPIVLKKNCTSALTPCLVKVFRLCLSTSTFFSCWKHGYVQLASKKGDRSNPSSYRPIAISSYLSKAFKTILNMRFLKYLSSFNRLSDHQYGCRKRHSTGGLLVILTGIWSSSPSRVG